MVRTVVVVREFCDCWWGVAGYSICFLVWKDEMESDGLACRPMVGVCYVARLFAIILSLLL